MTLPSYHDTVDFPSVHGLFCYRTTFASGLVVYNSSTGRSITLPKFEHKGFLINHFLGYDPIDDVYKVLCLTKPRSVFHMEERDFVFQVLTLGNGNSWKVIENSHTLTFPLRSQICINGIVYCKANVGKEHKEAAVMSFDVRSEKFHVIKRPGDAHSNLNSYLTMVRYEEKLAIMYDLIPAYGSIVLWVLDDAVKHEWSKKVFVLPNSWTSLQVTKTISRVPHYFIDVTDAGEFLLAPILLCVPLSTYYVLCDPKRNSVRKVEIEGITEHKDKMLHYKKRQAGFRFHLFSSQVESLMYL